MAGMRAWAGLVWVVVLLAGCHVEPVRILGTEEEPIRQAAREFTQALRDGDRNHLQDSIVVEGDAATSRLAQAVIADSVSGRRIQLQLARRFDHHETRSSVVGGDAWIAQIETAAACGPILRAGRRVRIGEAGCEGAVFLRQEKGRWKVQIVPTLVVECGGGEQLDDPVVDYRFNVTRAVNEYLLERLSRGEFRSLGEFVAARDAFWMEYLLRAAHGEDPHDAMLSTLPRIPPESLIDTGQ